MLLQKKVNGGKERSADTFVAGLLGGYVVFGDRTAVNEQVSNKPALSPDVSDYPSLLSPDCSLRRITSFGIVLAPCCFSVLERI
jgi:hypothetical protein